MPSPHQKAVNDKNYMQQRTHTNCVVYQGSQHRVTHYLVFSEKYGFPTPACKDEKKTPYRFSSKTLGIFAVSGRKSSKEKDKPHVRLDLFIQLPSVVQLRHTRPVDRPFVHEQRQPRVAPSSWSGSRAGMESKLAIETRDDACIQVSSVTQRRRIGPLRHCPSPVRYERIRSPAAGEHRRGRALGRRRLPGGSDRASSGWPRIESAKSRQRRRQTTRPDGNVQARATSLRRTKT